MAKQKFKIVNRPRHRGSLTVWLDEAAIAAWSENTVPKHRGQPLHYTDTGIRSGSK